MLRKTNGFTIVELLIVIVVIAILASIAVVAFNGVAQRAKDSAVEANINNIFKKIGEHQAIEGEYRQDILIASDDAKGGVLSLSEISVLADAGMQPDLLRNPDAPAGVMNSFVFDQYNDTTNQWLSEVDNSENFQMTAATDLPAGYSSWEDVWDEVYTVADTFYEDYVQSHPMPGDGADDAEWDAWEASFEAAFYNEYPQFAGLGVFSGAPTVDVPKTQVYFVQLLGDAPQPEDDCSIISGNTHFYCHNSADYSEIPITGMKIIYYSRVDNDWKDKTVGSGQPFRRASVQLPK